MKLIQRINSSQHIGEIGNYLDTLTSHECLQEIQTLRKSHQKKLYDLAQLSKPLSLDHFASKKPLQEVIHDGRNSLPIFSLFQKRFCRANDESNRIFGYNQGPTTKWIGPGYFVAKTTVNHPEWSKRGSIVIDYYEVPDGDVVSSWPTIVPNSVGVQQLVYHQMRDFMRRVSDTVSVGVAYQKGKNLNQYFVLCKKTSASNQS